MFAIIHRKMLILFSADPTIILYQLTRVCYSVVNTVYPHVISLCYDNTKSFFMFIISKIL